MHEAQPTAPSPKLELEAIALVKDKLLRRYPDVAPERVDSVVDDHYHRFDRSPVRTFVPVLVEHEANAELSDPAIAPHPPATSSMSSASSMPQGASNASGAPNSSSRTRRGADTRDRASRHRRRGGDRRGR